MLVIISVIFVSLIAWGIVSKEQLEGEIRASFVKTCLYLFFGIIVAIIFYKTYQVGINTNRVYIHRLMGFTNEEGESLDSVQITIYHRMNPDNLRNLLEYDEHVRKGGFHIAFVPDYRNAKIERDSSRLLPAFYQIHEFKKLNDSIPSNNYIHSVLRKYDEQLEKHRPKVKQLLRAHEEYKNDHQGLDYPYYTHEDSVLLIDALDYTLAGCSHWINVLYSTTKEQSLLPFEKKFNNKSQWGCDSNMTSSACIEIIQMSDLIDNQLFYNIDGRKIHLDSKFLKELNMHNTPFYRYLVGISKNHKWFDANNWHYNAVAIANQQPTFNSVNFLTASDMSQRIFETQIHSEIPIRSLEILFDVPIDISGIYPQPDIVTMRSIHYTNREKLDYLRNQSLDFHAKLPTFENKQLVRSLVITTILVAILSLFCANLYEYCINIHKRVLRDRKSFVKLFSFMHIKKGVITYLNNIKKQSKREIRSCSLKVFSLYVFIRFMYLYIIYANGNPLIIEYNYSFASFVKILFSW